MVDKPAGWTSHDVVNKVRRLYGTKRVGHAGTLDPAATGVLVVCLGAATRLLEYLTGCDKAYRGQVVLGVETDSYDADGRVLFEQNAGHLAAPAVEAALATFAGVVDQVPPAVSAKKIAGQPAHKLVRQGKAVDLPAVRVVFHDLRLLGFRPGVHPVADLAVTCGAGAYIRSLAHDLGQTLGVGGHLAALRRERVGEYALAEAVSLPAVEALDPTARLALLSRPERVVAHLPRGVVGSDALLPLRQGKVLPGSAMVAPPPPGDGVVALYDEAGGLLAIAEPVEGGWHPHKVLAGPLTTPE